MSYKSYKVKVIAVHTATVDVLAMDEEQAREQARELAQDAAHCAYELSYVDHTEIIASEDY